jgi:LPXTG-site transpeptidase (sortase) family protein
MKKFWLGFFTGIILLTGGIVLFFMPLFIRSANAGEVAQPAPVPAQVAPKPQGPDIIQGEPTRIVIPSVNIDIPVTDGYYNAAAKVWTLTLDKAQYAVMTPQPNNKSGNTFIYGHNRAQVFNRLPRIQAGAIATIYTDNGHVFTYTFRDSRTTDPSDASLFEYEGAPILTLQTCTGLLYQNRQLFTFDLTGVK